MWWFRPLSYAVVAYAVWMIFTIGAFTIVTIMIPDILKSAVMVSLFQPFGVYIIYQVFKTADEVYNTSFEDKTRRKKAKEIE